MSLLAPRRGVQVETREPTLGRPQVGGRSRSTLRRVAVGLGTFVAGLAVSSSIAHAHEFGHGTGPGGAGELWPLVLGLPALAGLASGLVAVRHGTFRRPRTVPHGSGVTVGLLLVGLGAASLLQAVAQHRLPSVVGGIGGATVALWIGRNGAAPGTDRGNRAELAFGAVSTHRLLEGIVLGTLYSTGAAIGFLGATVLAGHATLETAAVGLTSARESRRRAIVAVVLVQVGYVSGVVVGVGVTYAVPSSVRTLALAVVGGVLLVTGAVEAGRSTGDGSPFTGRLPWTKRDQ